MNYKKTKAFITITAIVLCLAVIAACNDEFSFLGNYSVKPHDMENAGYTLDGSDDDYLKVAEYCVRLKLEELMHCSTNNPNHCRKVDAGNFTRVEDTVTNGTRWIHCPFEFYFVPTYPKAFTSAHADIQCSVTAPDDPEHPFWICFGGQVYMAKTYDGWLRGFSYGWG